MKISIIIPTYNEKDNIIKLVKKIYSVVVESKLDYNIIVVDDGSPDGTADVANKLDKKYNVVVINRGAKLGYGSAIVEGFRKALDFDSDYIFTMDSDLSHNPKYLLEMIPWLNKFDVVIGSRKIVGGKIVGWNLWRHMCSWGGNIFARFVLGLKIKDVTTGYRGYNSKVIKSLDLGGIKSDGYSFLEELVYLIQKKGYSFKEVPIVFVDRKLGKSKLSKTELIKFFVTIVRLRFT